MIQCNSIGVMICLYEIPAIHSDFLKFLHTYTKNKCKILYISCHFGIKTKISQKISTVSITTLSIPMTEFNQNFIFLIESRNQIMARLYICQFVFLWFARMSACSSVHPFIGQSVHLPGYPYVGVSVYPTLRLFVCPSVLPLTP